jgi:hypothetical protein
MAAGILLEVYALARGRLPLTGYARSRILNRPLGAATTGAFLLWMVWHWLGDVGGLGTADVVSVAAGALLGLAGWWYRRR